MNWISWQNVMQGVYIPLVVLSAWSALLLWRRVAIPAWRDGLMARYVMGIGGTFISTGVALECLLYGTGRWFPATIWTWNIYPVTVFPKILYIFGMVLILACATREPDRPARVRKLLWVALGLTAAGFFLAGLDD